MSLKYYVYMHTRKDTGQVFYIGKGSSRRKTPFERAYAKDRRNQRWVNIVNLVGYDVDIVCQYETNQEALDAEIRLIRFFGRKNLSNMTDGGDGTTGVIISDDLRRIRSINSSGPRSQAFKDAIKKARKNGGNGGVVNKGDTLPDWWRERISAAVTGDKNSMYGKTGARHPTSRKVIKTDGTIYVSVEEAARMEGINYKTLYNSLSGQRNNKTGMRFADAS